MQTLSTTRFEETAIILEAGKDYHPSDLVPDKFTNNKLYHLTAEKLTAIAKAAGFDKWSWAGHEVPHSELIKFTHCTNVAPSDGTTLVIDKGIDRGIPVRFKKYLARGEE